MPRAASSVCVGRRVKRETVLVSYNDLDASLTGNINDTPPSFEYCWLPPGRRENFMGLLICTQADHPMCLWFKRIYEDYE